MLLNRLVPCSTAVKDKQEQPERMGEIRGKALFL